MVERPAQMRSDPRHLRPRRPELAGTGRAVTTLNASLSRWYASASRSNGNACAIASPTASKSASRSRLAMIALLICMADLGRAYRIPVSTMPM
jgi:hypothetical protein